MDESQVHYAKKARPERLITFYDFLKKRKLGAENSSVIARVGGCRRVTELLCSFTVAAITQLHVCQTQRTVDQKD